MTRKADTSWSFGPSLADKRRAARERRAQDRALLRRRRAELKAQKRADERRKKQAKRLDLKLRRDARRRQRALVKKQRLEKHRWLKQQKRQMMGTGGSGRTGQNAAAMRTARNLLTLANSIGVRFTDQDRDELIAYADQEMAASGEDVYTIYQRLSNETFLGKKIMAVVGEYDIADVDSEDQDPAWQDNLQDRLLKRVMQAAQMIGAFQRTNRVDQSMELAEGITEALGATPEAIKADQQARERDAIAQARQAVSDEINANTEGKNRLQVFLDKLLHPERYPDIDEAARERALEELDAADRAVLEPEVATAQRMAAATGETASVQNDNIFTSAIDRVRALVGL